jgi:hypothetical protein
MEGLLRHEAGNRFDVFSAGIRPSQVRAEAIAVMRELASTPVSAPRASMNAPVGTLTMS